MRRRPYRYGSGYGVWDPGVARLRDSWRPLMRGRVDAVVGATTEGCVANPQPALTAGVPPGRYWAGACGGFTSADGVGGYW
jgi:hypothetical protein